MGGYVAFFSLPRRFLQYIFAEWRSIFCELITRSTAKPQTQNNNGPNLYRQRQPQNLGDGWAKFCFRCGGNDGHLANECRNPHNPNVQRPPWARSYYENRQGPPSGLNGSSLE